MRLHDQPTRAEPGTLEKLEVLIRRYAEGLELFHPRDNRSVNHENVCVRLLVGGKRESNNRSSGRQRKSRAKWRYHEPQAQDWFDA